MLTSADPHEQRTPRAEAELFFCGSVSIVVAVVGAAIVGDVCSSVEGQLSPKVG